MPTAIAKLHSLPSYKIQLLNAVEEIEILERNVSLLAVVHGFEQAYDVCASSQTVLYALDDLKLANGADELVYRSKLQHAADLLASVAAYREQTLKSVQDSQIGEVEVYFNNVGKRHKELVRRQQR